MPNLLLLPEPQSCNFKKRLLVMLAIILISLSVLSFWKINNPTDSSKASLLEQSKVLESQSEEREMLEKAKQEVLEKNNTPIQVFIDEQAHNSIYLKDLGFSFVIKTAETKISLGQFILNKLFSKLQVAAAADHNETEAFPLTELQIDKGKWLAYVNQLRDRINVAPQDAGIVWVADQGWTYQEIKSGTELDMNIVKQEYQNFLAKLAQNENELSLAFQTNTLAAYTGFEEAERLKQLYQKVLELVKDPLVLTIAEDTVFLDLNETNDFLRINDLGVEVNESQLQSWISALANKYYQASQKVKIVDKEEIRPRVFKAVTEGEFLEGKRLDAAEVQDQIFAALENGLREIEVRTYEIPVKVYSELEEANYELLSVGYSEYSHGNAPNRVHNIETGLSRLNGILIEPGQEISFNNFTGDIDSEFKSGWGIFGTSALPVLGGGICQVSTTFYRALLNLGVPITMRQNHSWDLDYYQAGGYGLDATIYPPKGLDVKAENNLNSSLLIYSYTRPETEEAFVLIYGQSDGRQVKLEPEKEYVPFKGAKTLKWRQIITMPDGELIENQIVSKYRS